MKEHPLLFSDPMVRALQAHRKTQTRRVLGLYPDVLRDEAGYWYDRKTGDFLLWKEPVQPGDRIWVREAWADVDDFQREERERARAEGRPFTWDPGVEALGAGAFYRADPGAPRRDELVRIVRTKRGQRRLRGWRPGIHLPRTKARILLEVTKVGVERLRDISEADAVAEGSCIRHDFLEPHAAYAECLDIPGARGCFANAWDELNRKRGFGWDANPLVRVRTFRILQPAIPLPLPFARRLTA